MSISILSTSSSSGNSFLPSVELSPEQVFEGKNRLISVEEDGGISASFVLHFLLADYLKWKSPQNSGGGEFSKCLEPSLVSEDSLSAPDVVLVLTANTSNHWTTISSRIGPQLTKYLQTGRIKVLNPLRDLFESLLNPSGTAAYSSNNDESISQLQSLYNTVVRINPAIVIIEDLEFFSVSTNRTDVLRFLAKLRRLPMTTIVGHVPNPLGPLLASTRFIVSELETGASSTVSAVLNVISSRQIRSYHYKLDERSIKLTFKPRTQEFT